jgi:hypothetical protein
MDGLLNNIESKQLRCIQKQKHVCFINLFLQSLLKSTDTLPYTQQASKVKERESERATNSHKLGHLL